MRLLQSAAQLSAEKEKAAMATHEQLLAQIKAAEHAQKQVVERHVAAVEAHGKKEREFEAAHAERAEELRHAKQALDDVSSALKCAVSVAMTPPLSLTSNALISIANRPTAGGGGL